MLNSFEKILVFILLFSHSYFDDIFFKFLVLQSGVWYSSIIHEIEKVGRVEILRLSGNEFRKEAAFKTSINWVCRFPNCSVRLQTSDLGIKFSKSTNHNH